MTFRESAFRFLRDNLPPRQADVSMGWGVGSDRISIPIVGGRTEAEESAALEEAVAWRRRRADAGFGWVSGPPDFGGEGRSADDEHLFEELESRFQAPDPSYTRTGIAIVGPSILRFGTEEAKHRYLRDIYRGDTIVCQLFSEPNAGSDLANVRTTARRHGDDWVISGQKVWSSGARFADVGECLVRTTTGRSGHAGLSMLLVDMHAPGIDVRPIHQMTGATEFCEVFLEDVRVPASSLLGNEGDGWRVTLDTLANERKTIGKELVPADEFLRRLVDLAHHARPDGAARDAVVSAIMSLRVSSWLADSLAHRAQSNGATTNLGKLAACNSVTAITEAVSTVLGSRLVANDGEWGHYAWSELLLGLPGLRIGGGTDEILKSAVAERVLGLPREPRPDK